MGKYIERKALLNALKEERKNGNFVFTSKWIKEIMDDLPTANVALKNEIANEIAEWLDGEISKMPCYDREFELYVKLTIEQLKNKYDVTDTNVGSKYIKVPCKIGGKIYEVIQDEELSNGCGVFELTVTEVGQNHIWVSAYDPPTEDIDVSYPINEIGKTIFLTRSEAEKALAEREQK